MFVDQYEKDNYSAGMFEQLNAIECHKQNNMNWAFYFLLTQKWEALLSN